MRIGLRAGIVLLVSVCAAHAQLKVAGELLVNVDAASLSAWTPDTAVSAWTNAGSLGGNFVPAVAGTGAVYQPVSAVYNCDLAASASSMHQHRRAGSLAAGDTVWSAEIWVLNPFRGRTYVLDRPRVVDRLGDGTCMEIITVRTPGTPWAPAGVATFSETARRWPGCGTIVIARRRRRQRLYRRFTAHCQDPAVSSARQGTLCPGRGLGPRGQELADALQRIDLQSARAQRHAQRGAGRRQLSA